MKYSDRQISRIAGTLTLLGILIGIFSIVPSVESNNFLNEVYPEKNQVYIAGIFQFILIPLYIGFSLLFYRQLRPYNNSLSLGFVSFRFISATFQFIGVMLIPLFVLLSKNYINSSSAEIDSLTTLGDLLRSSRDLINHFGVILATSMGNLLFYLVLYKGKLIPKYLSISGFIGNISIMVAGFLVFTETIEVVSLEYAWFSIPLVLQEIAFAFWLLFRGIRFKKSVLASIPLQKTHP